MVLVLVEQSCFLYPFIQTQNCTDFSLSISEPIFHIALKLFEIEMMYLLHFKMHSGLSSKGDSPNSSRDIKVKMLVKPKCHEIVVWENKNEQPCIM